MSAKHELTTPKDSANAAKEERTKLTDREIAEIKAREIATGWFHTTTRAVYESFVLDLTNQLLEFSQGSTVGDFKFHSKGYPLKLIGTDGCRTCETGRVSTFVVNDQCTECNPSSYESHPPRVVVPESVSDEELEIGRRAIELALIDWRDSRLSEFTRSNGLVIREKDGTDSSIIRFGPETALKIGIDAIVKHRAALSKREGGE